MTAAPLRAACRHKKGDTVADSKLTKEQALSLLNKLAHDDAFRAHFEAKPAEAMFRHGIPAELICCLAAACHCPRKLASKAELEHAHQRLAADRDLSMLA